MAKKVTRSILSATFGAAGMLAPRSHDFNVNRQDFIHGAGADVWASAISAEVKFFQVVVGFDDANSVAALLALLDTDAALTVKDLNHGSRVAGRQWAYSTAHLMDVTGAERFAVAGEFAGIFFVGDPSGAASLLQVTGY